MDQDQDHYSIKDVSYILSSIHDLKNPPGQAERFQFMQGFMERVGLSVDDLDRLKIIHVAGTKGKGSTCAYTEQILRNYGYRTGFFSSPHLVEIRERIRVNGQPIREELFNKHLRQTYRRLDETKDAFDDWMPRYFSLFTLMAFRVFLEEKVDVAIIEVGIGGQYDATNIIRRPWVCGVSSLGIDHIQMLGDTIEKIAWHKGGIFKAGVPAFTVKQPEGVMPVLEERAKEINCPLWVCPDLEDYQTDCGLLHLSLAGKHQHPNASLALQLSHTWIQRRCSPDQSLLPTLNGNNGLLQAAPFKPSPSMVRGLAETMWPGRAQIVKHGAVTYFLDGAHTIRSIQACAQWFTESSAQLEKTASGPVARVLLFNMIGERDGAAMLKLLKPCGFDCAVFCPNIPNVNTFCQTDLWNVSDTVEDMMMTCLENEKRWRLCSIHGDINGSHHVLSEDGLSLVLDRTPDAPLVFPCVLSALCWISQGRDPVLTDSGGSVPVKPSLLDQAAPLCDAAEIHVLITGSIRLVGGALKNLNPESYK